MVHARGRFFYSKAVLRVTNDRCLQWTSPKPLPGADVCHPEGCCFKLFCTVLLLSVVLCLCFVLRYGMKIGVTNKWSLPTWALVLKFCRGQDTRGSPPGPWAQPWRARTLLTKTRVYTPESRLRDPYWSPSLNKVIWDNLYPMAVTRSRGSCWSPDCIKALG